MDDGRKGEHAHAGYMMKGWKLRLLRLLDLLIIVCVGAAACSKKDNDTAQEPFTVKLGVLLDFSGDKKEESEEMYRAVSLAVDEINASGGVLTEGYSIELIKKDEFCCGLLSACTGGRVCGDRNQQFKGNGGACKGKCLS